MIDIRRRLSLFARSRRVAQSDQHDQ